MSEEEYDYESPCMLSDFTDDKCNGCLSPCPNEVIMRALKWHPDLTCDQAKEHKVCPKVCSECPIGNVWRDEKKKIVGI